MLPSRVPRRVKSDSPGQTRNGDNAYSSAGLSDPVPRDLGDRSVDPQPTRLNIHHASPSGRSSFVVQYRSPSRSPEDASAPAMWSMCACVIDNLLDRKADAASRTAMIRETTSSPGSIDDRLERALISKNANSCSRSDADLQNLVDHRRHPPIGLSTRDRRES